MRAALRRRRVVGLRHVSRPHRWLAVFFAVAMTAGVVETMAAATPAGAATVIVSASSLSTDSGVSLASGQTATVTASGSWNVDPNQSATGPEGLGTPCAGNCLAPGLSYQSLLGSLDGGGSWFEIGLGVTVTGPGELLLAADDGPCCYADNTGSVNVTITPEQIDSDLDFTPPANITANATSAAGAVVSFATPVATDGDDESAPPVSCASGGGLVSGSAFPIGVTTVSCSVTDPDDTPSTVTHSFTVTLYDPGITIVHVNSVLVAATGPGGASVSFPMPKGSDLRGLVSVSCDHESGTTFPPGQSTVVCTATGDSFDVPATAQTTFGVYVNAGAPPPNPPTIGTATPGDGSASVAVGPPAPNGSYSIGSYTVTCTSSDGAPGTGSGTGTPVVVTGLTNGKTYTCTATASTGTNPPQTSGPSGQSNAFVPTAGVVTCTDTQVCNANSSSGSSSSAPAGSVDVKGTTDLPTGSISVVAGGAPVACPGSSIAVLPGTTMSDTGFSSANSLTVTITLRAVATGHAKVCYSSTIPFLSESHPTVPTAGVGILLRCSVVANQAPCLLLTRNTASTVVATILVPGGDPTFSVVLPTGRLVWPSTFPNGKVGTAYSTHLLSKGGKAPFHWKITSGKLPPGLAINAASGTVTGKPTAKGTFKCVVHVTDSEARPQSANISVSITIS